MLKFLNNKYGTNFDEQELNHIKDFSLIWNIFEGSLFNSHFSINQLKGNLATKNIDVTLFQEHLDYF